MAMASDGSTLSWAKVREVTIELLESSKDRSWGDFKSAAAERLGVSVEALKIFKMEMKELIARGLEADGDVDEGESGREYEKNGARKGCGSDANIVIAELGGAVKGPKMCNNGSSKGGDEESRAMKALKQMAKAMNLGPRPFKGLKQMASDDAEKSLRERLIDAGGDFSGAFPSAMEIARAKRRTDKAKDLEGIDMGNVVQGSRRRGQPEIAVQPSKKRRSADDRVSGGESGHVESESNRESGGEDSEIEFEL